MLSHSNPAPPNTLRERFQQYRRRHSISQRSSPETPRRFLLHRRSLDLSRHQNKQTHDEPPQLPQTLTHKNNPVPQRLSHRQSQSARDSRNRNPEPTGLNQSARGATCHMQPGHVPPSAAHRRSQSHDCSSKSRPTTSQHAGLVVQRCTTSAECDTLVGNSNITARPMPSGVDEGRIAPQTSFNPTSV